MEYLLLLQILLTEIHPTPAAGEPEWVECAIISQGSVDLAEIMICDNRSCVRMPARRIASGSCLVFTRDEPSLREARTLDDSVVVVECAFPSLNNTSDRVEIRRADSSIIDVVAYAITSPDRGRSIERHGTDDNGIITYSDRWSASTAFDSATCGRVNSHVVYELDAAITGMFVQDSSIHIGVVNAGRKSLAGQPLSISVGTRIFTRQCPQLSPSQWWSTTIDLLDLNPTSVVRSDCVMVQLQHRDMQMDNNIYRSTITVPTAAGGVTITEILADPHVGDCDMVELWNGTTDTLDLTGWTLQDAGGDVCRIISPIRLPPNEYVACASDTAIARMSGGNRWALLRPNLNVNSVSDTVMLRTSSGFIVDKAIYSKDRHSRALSLLEGRSLEKRIPNSVDDFPSSWGSSTAQMGSTPGAANSINTDLQRRGQLLMAMPSPFSTREGASRFPCVITWQQPFEQALARLMIVDLDGTPIAQLLNGQFIGTHGSVTWDGVNTFTMAFAPIGIYVASFECIDANSLLVQRMTCPVVIGESQ